MSVHIPEYVRTGGFIPDAHTMDSIRRSVASVAARKVPSDSKSREGTRATTRDGAPAFVYAVNEQLLPTSSDLNDAETEMLTTTILWIQHVLIGHCTGTTNGGLGWSQEKFSDPDTRNSQDFFDAVSFVVQMYTPWVGIAGTFNTTYKDQTHKGDINILSVVEKILSAVAPPAAAEQMAQAAAQIVSRDMSVGVSNVGNFFWNSKYHSESKCQYLMSPGIKTSPYAVEYSYLLTYQSIIQEDWRTLFVSHTYEQFIFSASSLQIELYLSQWTAADPDNPGQTVRSSVRARLAQWLANEIHGAPIG